MRAQKGFTLVELAIATLLFGFLVSALLWQFSDREAGNRLTTLNSQLENIRAHLYQFVKINGYLPCPDSRVPVDGLEDRSADGACHRQQGRLPWRTLGVERKDVWGNDFYYRVNSRADDGARVHDVCESAAAFGKSGTLTATDLVRCDATRVYYCNGALMQSQNATRKSDEWEYDDYKICPDGQSTVITGTDYKNDMTSAGLPVEPPFIGLFTPPVGGDAEGKALIKVYDERGTGNEQNRIAGAVEALVLSFGKNGAYTWHNTMNDGKPLSAPTLGRRAQNECGSLELTAAEKENCDGDEIFILDGQDDRAVWLDIFDVKRALIEG